MVTHFLSRRGLLWRSAVAAGGFVVAACGGSRASSRVPAASNADSSATTITGASPGAAPSGASPASGSPSRGAAAATAVAPTPACGDADDDLTIAQTEGPYFKPNSPERSSLLEPGMPGTKLTLAGVVRTTGCQPVARALIDFWQADDGGDYDNSGFRLRGHQFTAADGSYRLETIVPGLYPGRTRHIHVRVQAPNGPVLITQLYFPAEPRNSSDGIFSPELLMAFQKAGGAATGAFDFVVKAA